MLSGLLIFFGQNRLICGHNIDKNDIFIQRNKSCQEDMLHFILFFNTDRYIRIIQYRSSSAPGWRPCALCFHLWTAYITMKLYMLLNSIWITDLKYISLFHFPFMKKINNNKNNNLKYISIFYSVHEKKWSVYSDFFIWVVL